MVRQIKDISLFFQRFFLLTSGASENEVIAKRSKLAFILAKIELVKKKSARFRSLIAEISARKVPP